MEKTEKNQKKDRSKISVKYGLMSIHHMRNELQDPDFHLVEDM